MSAGLRQLRVGVSFALVAMVFGFGLGGVFGAAESSVKGTLKASAAKVLDSVYKGDKGKAKKVTKKAWSYLKRAHLHGGAIGAGALAVILLLASLQPLARLRMVAGALLGLGALGYGVFWLAAGFTAPSAGSTHAAKESLKLLGLPSAGACLVGLCLACVCFAVAATRREER